MADDVVLVALEEAARSIHTAVPGAMNAQMAEAFEKVGLALDALAEERRAAEPPVE